MSLVRYEELKMGRGRSVEHITLDDLLHKVIVLGMQCQEFRDDLRQQKELAGNFPTVRVRPPLTSYTEENGPAVGTQWAYYGFEDEPKSVSGVSNDFVEFGGNSILIKDFIALVNTGEICYCGQTVLSQGGVEEVSESENSEWIIFVNDSNGHSHAYAGTLPNMKLILRATLEANKCDTCYDEPKDGYDLLAKSNVTADEIREFIDSECALTQRGGMLHFLQIESSGKQIKDTLFT